MFSAPENLHIHEEDSTPDNNSVTLSRRAALGLVFGGIAAATVGCGPNSASPNVPATPSPERPTPSEEESSPSASEELPELESQEEEGFKILALPHLRFNHRDMIDRQLAVDAKDVQFVNDNDVGLAIANGELGIYSPAFLSASKRSNREATAHSILNQLKFAKAAVFGQQEDPKDFNNKNLDQNTAANMVSGYYYNHEGPEAKAMAERALKTKNAQSYGSEQLVPEKAILSSSNLLPHNFGGDLGELEIRVIKYVDGDNRKWKIVTPYESTYIGPDPLGTNEIVETTVVKWLVVTEGDGDEDIKDILQNYN